MIFEHPSWLWLSLVIPVPWLIWRGRGYFGHTAPWIGGSGGLVRVLHLVPILIRQRGIAPLFIALAQPQHPYTLPDQTIKARDIVIAVDKSGIDGPRSSMVQCLRRRLARPFWTSHFRRCRRRLRLARMTDPAITLASRAIAASTQHKPLRSILFATASSSTTTTG